ncbi:MAG: hypothetical protein OXL97_01855 [Chloroflexota bacterium]|nr:hypothetical protein [Chloroflexota bacterium]MDE2886462.1 hypothetical protein [Chloroflexota bacterium]
MVNVAERLIDSEGGKQQGAGLNFCNGFCFGMGLWLAGLAVVALAVLLLIMFGLPERITVDIQFSP